MGGTLQPDWKNLLDKKGFTRAPSYSGDKRSNEESGRLVFLEIIGGRTRFPRRKTKSSKKIDLKSSRSWACSSSPNNWKGPTRRYPDENVGGEALPEQKSERYESTVGGLMN